MKERSFSKLEHIKSPKSILTNSNKTKRIVYPKKEVVKFYSERELPKIK
jgi:hypothetical protein